MASTSMLTPITSENRITSWRFSSLFWPRRVRKSIAAAHSFSVGSMSRTKPCRCLIIDCMICFRRALGMSCQRCSTTSVRVFSVTEGIGFLPWKSLTVELAANDGGAVDHGLHLSESDRPWQVLHAAIRSDDDPLGRHVGQRLADAARHDV